MYLYLLCAQVLSTGQVPAEFAVPKPDANMAEASDGAEKMDTDGENQEGGEADGQKQGEGSTPIQEVMTDSDLGYLIIWFPYG